MCLIDVFIFLPGEGMELVTCSLWASCSLFESMDPAPLTPTCRAEPARGVMVAACLHSDSIASGRTVGRGKAS